jgi:hypothetical protein
MYLFRRKLPLRLRERFATSELALSLGSRDPTIAAGRARMAWICTEAIFSVVDRAPGISLNEIKARVRRDLAAWIEEAEGRLACGETMAGLWPGCPDSGNYAELAENTRAAIARNDLAAADPIVASGAIGLSEGDGMRQDGKNSARSWPGRP